MALKASLDGISSSLSGILGQLKEIEQTQQRITASAGAYKSAVSGVSGGMGSGGVGASGGIMPGSLGGFSTPPAGSGGSAAAGARMGASGSTLGRALGGIATIGAIGIDAAWNMSPGVQDSVAYQSALFQTARYGAAGYDPNAARRLQASFGPYMSGRMDVLAAGQIATMRGQGISSGTFDFQARQAASITALTGMNNAAAMGAATSMYMGSTSGNLARYGLFTNNLTTGKPKDLGAIVDDLWARWLGSKNAKISMEELNAQISGGFIGNDLRNLFGNDPDLYQTMVSLVLQKGQSGGMSTSLSRTSGRGSAIGQSQRMGNTEMNNPALTGYRVESERFDTLAKTADTLNEGYRQGAEAIIKLNDAMQYLADAIGPEGALFREFLKLKGTLETINGSTEGGAAGGALKALLGVAGGYAAGRYLTRGARPATGRHAAPKTGMGGTRTGGGATRAGGVSVRGGAMAALAAIALSQFMPEGGAKDFVFGPQQAPLDPLDPNNLTLEDVTTPGPMVWNSAGGLLGGPGSSTGDNIRANLSRGEYVINARAAQAIGVDRLNALNSIGQTFGSAYASPARNFASGGTTLDGWDVLQSGDDQLQTFSVAGKSVTLRKDYGPMLVKLLNEYANDPVLAPITYLGGHEPRRAYDPNTGTYTGGWSNHAAGVAIDVDADDWGMPPGRDITPAEMTSIKRLLANNPGIEWGGYWTGSSRDAMHYEVRDPSVPASGGSSATPSSPTSSTGTAEETSARKRGMLGAVPASVRIMTGASLLSPAASALSGTTGFVKGYSLPGLGSSSRLNASFTTGAMIASRLSSITGQIRGSGVMGGAGSRSLSGSAKDAVRPPSESSSINYNSAAGGKGGEWLYQFLVDHGLRGTQLQIAWTIGMRESGGDPSNTTHGGTENWTSGGYPYYDVGVFQINNRHLSGIRSKFGNDADMSLMLDPNKNFEYMVHLSNSFKNLSAWGLNPDGQTWDWSQYSADWRSKYQSATESNHASWWSKYSGYNKYNYSQGAYRTHEGVAKLHEGEMVMPAVAAEEFRQAMREYAGGRGSAGNITINLTIDKASDAEAERFAKRVKKMLEDDSYLSSMRTR